MIRLPATTRCLLLLALCLGGSGCFPAVEGKLDEQKDPHYLNGRTRVSSQDYRGAIEEFEKALETNPRSASAHFELGWLYEEYAKDYAEAIHHYQWHLRLRPKSDYSERARERIKACKMDLAKTEVMGPITQDMQRDLTKLISENLLLKRQVEILQTQLASRPLPETNRPPVFSGTRSGSQSGNSSGVALGRNASSTGPGLQANANAARGRSHTVKSGDTIAAIARRYNVKLPRLQAANPQMDPRRLKVGQMITIPDSI